METINSFDIILTLIKACKDEKSYFTVPGPTNHDIKLGASFYLLGQAVRNLWNQKNHRCVSKKALDLWNSLNIGKPIFDYAYQDPIYYKNLTPVHIKLYKGASNTPYFEGNIQCLKKNDHFKFREAFHIDHIVPINIILEQLLELDLSLDKETLYNKLNFIVDKIYVCFILKEEDRKLNKISKSKRSDNYLEVLKNDYKKAEIEIARWN